MQPSQTTKKNKSINAILFDVSWNTRTLHIQMQTLTTAKKKTYAGIWASVMHLNNMAPSKRKRMNAENRVNKALLIVVSS